MEVARKLDIANVSKALPGNTATGESEKTEDTTKRSPPKRIGYKNELML